MLKLILQLALGALIGVVISILLLGSNGEFLARLAPLTVSAVSVIVFVLIGVVIHEFGHLVFGLLTGYRFSSFRVGSLVWFKEGDKIRFKTSGSLVAGQCLMIPPEKPEDFRFILYNLGGGLFNILFCLLLFVLLMLTSIITPVVPGNFWHSLFSAGIAMSGLLALVNLIPIKPLTNDGANIWEALKSKEAAYGMYMMFYINNEMMEGRRYRDFDEKLFKVSEDADLGNYMIAYLVMLKAARLEDLGQHDAFIELYNRLNIKKLPSLYRALIKADLLYYYTIYNQDFGKAREIYKDKKLRNLLKADMPTLMRVSAAYEFFVTDNKDKAAKLLAKAKNSVENLPNKGQRLMELEYIQKLEALMQKKKGTNHGT